MSGTSRDLSHICFAGETPPRRARPRAHQAGDKYTAIAPAEAEEPLDEFCTWVLESAGLHADAYRCRSLHRRLPACLRALKVRTTGEARELLERNPRLLARAIDLLLIGVTEFFRDPGVFDYLRTQVLPAFARSGKPLRIWSAACSAGAELYSVAILLEEAGLLTRSYLLGTDCRSEAVERAERGLFEAAPMQLVSAAVREKYFISSGSHWEPVAAIRRQVHWKIADLLTATEQGPWDIILWRNSAIYLRSFAAEKIWRQLASILAPEGVLIVGKAEQPPRDAHLARAIRSVYCAANAPQTHSAADDQPSFSPQSPTQHAILEQFS